MTIRVAAAGDLHVGADSCGRMAGAYAEIGAHADVFLLAGDLTRVGSVAEAECVVSELAGVSVPVVAVLGNHDHHAGEIEQLVARLESAGIRILEGSSTVVAANGTSVGIAGVKGFGGGFAGRCGSDFGEREMKDFVRHTALSARTLEESLASLRADVRVALMHYSPVPDTLVGEPLEIYPFLGSYLLAEAVDRAGADLVLHGHAHRGTERGVTPGGVRVRNVAQPVIRGPYRIYELSGSDRATPTATAVR